MILHARPDIIRSDTDEVGDGHTQYVKRSTHRADWNRIEFEAATSTSPPDFLTINCQTSDLATGQTASGGHDGNGLDLDRSSSAPELPASGPRFEQQYKRNRGNESEVPVYCNIVVDDSYIKEDRRKVWRTHPYIYIVQPSPDALR